MTRDEPNDMGVGRVGGTQVVVELVPSDEFAFDPGDETDGTSVVNARDAATKLSRLIGLRRTIRLVSVRRTGDGVDVAHATIRAIMHGINE